MVPDCPAQLLSHPSSLFPFRKSLPTLHCPVVSTFMAPSSSLVALGFYLLLKLVRKMTLLLPSGLKAIGTRPGLLVVFFNHRKASMYQERVRLICKLRQRQSLSIERQRANAGFEPQDPFKGLELSRSNELINGH